MAVTFILGRAGSGKTHHCVHALLSELERPNDARRLILLVPEQASFQMERTLATQAARGGYSRAAVLSFSRLTHQALAELGDAPEIITRAARIMALRAVATRLGKALRYYRQAAQTTGFFTQLERLIEELLAENVTPESLARAGDGLEPPTARRKLTELSALYQGYLDWLGRERIDPAARLALLRERLGRLDWLSEALFWVDGFAGFTGQELATFVELARRARRLTITLLVDPNSAAVRANSTPAALDLFQRTEVTYQNLRGLFETAGVPCTDPVILHPAPLPRFSRAPSLARLEAGLATPSAPRHATPQPMAEPSDRTVALLECVTHRDELLQAARAIRQKVIESDGALRFRDFALIARDLEPLAPLVADVFAEYEIPYFLDRRRPMRAHPLSRLVEALFQAVAEDFSVAATTRLLRTGLLPLEREQAEALENLVVAHSIHGLSAWREPQWEFSDELPSFTRKQQPNPVPSSTRAADKLDAARLGLITALGPVLDLCAQDPPPTAAVWVAAIAAVLEALSVRSRLESWIANHRRGRAWEQAETHRVAWESLCGVLDDLHRVLGDERLRADEVARMLSATLRDQTLGLAPPTLDQVLVSSIERSRHPEIKHTWVCAFNEGVFPARPAEDELLDGEERESLSGAGLAAPASHRSFGERLLAYIAFTRPSMSLTISYATVAEDGQPLLPSPLLADVRRVLTELQVTRPRLDPPPVSLPELARGYLQGRSSPAHQGHVSSYAALVDALRAELHTGQQINRLLRGLEYRNASESIVQCRASRADGLAWRGSPSEAETYLDCPFKHFAKHTLRLDAQRGPRPASWDLGSFAHEILAEITRRAAAQAGGVRAIPNERWAELVREVVDEFRGCLPADLPQRRPDMAFLAEFLYDFVGELVAVHASRWRRGQFEPRFVEQAFGAEHAKDGLPGLDLTLTDGRRVRLRGAIDRVDLCRHDGQTFALVYDYKSNASPLGGVYLTGGTLQTLTYLLAARDVLPDGEPVALAGVFLAPLYPDEKILSTQYAQSAAPDQQAMYMYRPRGLFTETAARLLDPQLAQTASPVARMRLKKDGGFDRAQSRDVLTDAGLTARLALARQTLLLAAEGIVGGHVEATPLIEAHTLACRRCDFQGLCRFDPRMNKPRVAESVLPTLDQFASDATESGGDA